MKHNIDYEAHLLYVQKQKHTRGDLRRAVSVVNKGKNKKKGLVKGECPASKDIHPKQRTETVGNTSYFTVAGRDCRLSVARGRVMKP